MALKRFRATWLAAEQIYTTEITRSSEQGLRESLAFWWSRDCADFEIIEIIEIRKEN
jgi:hypothetical protein